MKSGFLYNYNLSNDVRPTYVLYCKRNFYAMPLFGRAYFYYCQASHPQHSAIMQTVPSEMHRSTLCSRFPACFAFRVMAEKLRLKACIPEHEDKASGVLFFTFQNYDRVINFSSYVNKVEIDKILLKFVERKLHSCIIHGNLTISRSFESFKDAGRSRFCFEGTFVTSLSRRATSLYTNRSCSSSRKFRLAVLT